MVSIEDNLARKYKEGKVYHYMTKQRAPHRATLNLTSIYLIPNRLRRPCKRMLHLLSHRKLATHDQRESAGTR